MLNSTLPLTRTSKTRLLRWIGAFDPFGHVRHRGL
jgi:hypothetical protein